MQNTKTPTSPLQDEKISLGLRILYTILYIALTATVVLNVMFVMKKYDYSFGRTEAHKGFVVSWESAGEKGRRYEPNYPIYNYKVRDINGIILTVDKVGDAYLENGMKVIVYTHPGGTDAIFKHGWEAFFTTDNDVTHNNGISTIFGVFTLLTPLWLLITIWLIRAGVRRFTH